MRKPSVRRTAKPSNDDFCPHKNLLKAKELTDRPTDQPIETVQKIHELSLIKKKANNERSPVHRMHVHMRYNMFDCKYGDVTCTIESSQGLHPFLVIFTASLSLLMLKQMHGQLAIGQLFSETCDLAATVGIGRRLVPFLFPLLLSLLFLSFPIHTLNKDARNGCQKFGDIIIYLFVSSFHT